MPHNTQQQEKPSLTQEADRWSSLRRGRWTYDKRPAHRDLLASAVHAEQRLSGAMSLYQHTLRDAEHISAIFDVEPHPSVLPEALNQSVALQECIKVKQHTRERAQHEVLSREERALREQMEQEAVKLFLTELDHEVAGKAAATRLRRSSFDPDQLESVKRHIVFRETQCRLAERERKAERRLRLFRARPLPSEQATHVEDAMLPPRHARESYAGVLSLDDTSDIVGRRSRDESIALSSSSSSNATSRSNPVDEGQARSRNTPVGWHQLRLLDRQELWLLRKELRASRAREVRNVTVMDGVTAKPELDSAKESWEGAKVMKHRVCACCSSLKRCSEETRDDQSAPG
jgi:hypothetical protein